MSNATKEPRVVKLKPIDDRVVVRLCDPDDVSEGGIILVDSAKQVPQYAHVVSVGPGRPWPELIRAFQDGSRELKSDFSPRFPMSCSAGDLVVIQKYAGVAINVGDEELHILREDDILAVVDEE